MIIKKNGGENVYPVGKRLDELLCEWENSGSGVGDFLRGGWGGKNLLKKRNAKKGCCCGMDGGLPGWWGGALVAL